MPPDTEHWDDLNLDEVSPAIIREHRIARARNIFGLKPKKELKDKENQADQTAAEDWRTLDVTKVIRGLRNPDIAFVRKELMRLHIRWWRGSTEQLTQTLRAAGAPAKAIKETPICGEFLPSMAQIEEAWQ